VIADGQLWVTTALETPAKPEDAERRKKADTSGQPLNILEEVVLRAVGLDVRTGRVTHDIELIRVREPQWVHRQNSYASPSFADGRLYFHDREGITTVVKPGRRFESSRATPSTAPTWPARPSPIAPLPPHRPGRVSGRGMSGEGWFERQPMGWTRPGRVVSIRRMPAVLLPPLDRRSFLRTSVLGVATLVAGCRSASPRAAVEPEFHLAAISDTHIPGDRVNGHRGFNPWENLRRIVPDVVAAKPEGVIVCGDAARLDGKVADHEELRSLLRPLAAEVPVSIAWATTTTGSIS
jgi:hypothetical protein